MQTSASPARLAAEHAAVHDPRPSFVFFGVVSAISLVADIATKVWAEVTLLHRASHPIVLIEDHLNLTLAYNPGGAWGLLQNASEQLRKPFFVLVSMAAILFIVSLYGRLLPGQRALKWGLPLVLGGALGNLADRITRSQVIDFIDYRADWIRSMNEQVAKLVGSWSVTDHWPTFNVADIAICVGVGLMAVDMFTSRRGPEETEPAPMTQKSVAPPASEPAERADSEPGQGAQAELDASAPPVSEALAALADPASKTEGGTLESPVSPLAPSQTDGAAEEVALRPSPAQASRTGKSPASPNEGSKSESTKPDRAGPFAGADVPER